LPAPECPQRGHADNEITRPNHSLAGTLWTTSSAGLAPQHLHRIARKSQEKVTAAKGTGANDQPRPAALGQNAKIETTEVAASIPRKSLSFHVCPDLLYQLSLSPPVIEPIAVNPFGLFGYRAPAPHHPNPVE
jgi:hypothetical protein